MFLQQVLRRCLSSASAVAVPTPLIRELRARSAAPIIECKKALAESDLDLNAAADWLRSRGIVKAAVSASRTAAQGLIGLATSPDRKHAVLLQVNSETDFVARSKAFVDAVERLTEMALTADDIQQLKEMTWENGLTVADTITDLVLAVGENVVLRGFERLSTQEGVVASYLHNRSSHCLGQIGALVSLRSEASDSDALLDLGKKIAMHVTVAAPLSLNKESMDDTIVQAELRVQKEHAVDEGIKPQVIDRVIQGRMAKFFAGSCLEQQVYALGDEGVTVKQMVEAAQKELGHEVVIEGFRRVRVGDHVE